MPNKANSYINDLETLKTVNKDIVGLRAYDFSRVISSGVNVPGTFCITSLAFDDFIVSTGIVDDIVNALSNVRPFVRSSAKEASGIISNLIISSKIPEGIKNEIAEAYSDIGKKVGSPFVSIEVSNTISDDYIPKNDVSKYIEIKGIDDLLYNLKVIWTSLFTTDAIELRTNTYYEGPISTAALVRKSQKGELSGKFYSIPAITNEKGVVEIFAMYGVQDESIELDLVADSYKVDIDTKKIIEKNIIPQEEMIVKTKSKNAEGEKKVTVPISKNWIKHQKVDDKRILMLVDEGLKMEKEFKVPLEIDWVIDSGTVFIENVAELQIKNTKHPLVDLDSEKFFKKMNIKVNVDESKSSQVDLDEIETEIRNMIDHDKSYMDDEFSPRGTSVLDLQKKKIDYRYPKWTQKYKFITDIYLDVSHYNSSLIGTTDMFSGGYFESTEFLIEKGFLPETFFKDAVRVSNFISSLAVELATISRNFSKEPFIYNFSSLKASEFKELNVPETYNKYYGDERFLAYPQALVMELLAIKKARDEFDAENLNICLPYIRNVKNLEDLKTIISSQGVKRSKNFKLYAELAVPSFAYDLDQLKEGTVDGVIIDYYTLLKLLVYRADVRKVDYQVVDKLLEDVVKKLKKLKLEIIFKLDLVDKDVISNILRFRPSAFIFMQMPGEDEMKFMHLRETALLQKK